MPRAEQLVLPIQGLTLVSAAAPSTDVDLPTHTRGLLIGVAGTLNITLQGQDHDGVPFQAGLMPGNFQAVRSGGTAQNIWAIS